MNFQWWCAAQGEAWTWSWQAYPGVWLVVILVAVAGWRLTGGRGPEAADAEAAEATSAGDGWPPGRRRLAWGVGTLVLWAALDWPLGPLGASYLASVHMVQYLMIGLVAPALFLLGVPPEAWERLEERKGLVRFLSDVSNPLAAAVVFNVGMTLTHWPGVVDALRVSQLGSFFLDALWLACGLVLWWPVIAPVPRHGYFSPLFKILYLFVNGVLLTPPALMLLFSESPLYAVYELAPPIRTAPVIWDQQLAGALMKLGSAGIMGVGIALVAKGWLEDEGVLGAGSRS